MVRKAFGELEDCIISILRKRGRATVKDVQQTLGEKNKYTTVMTVMSRLYNKKIFGREKVGSCYEYWLLNDPDATLFERAKSKFFGVKTAEVVSYLIDRADDLSDEELSEIEKLIQAAKRGRHE